MEALLSKCHMHIHVDFDVIHVPGTTGADPDGSALHSLLDLLKGSLVFALLSDYNNWNGPESGLLRSPAHNPNTAPAIWTFGILVFVGAEVCAPLARAFYDAAQRGGAWQHEAAPSPGQPWREDGC